MFSYELFKTNTVDHFLSNSKMLQNIVAQNVEEIVILNILKNVYVNTVKTIVKQMTTGVWVVVIYTEHQKIILKRNIKLY